MARPRKTDEQKRKEGTYRKDRATPPSAQFRKITSVPEAPDSFDELGKAVWNTIVAELIELNILQSIDIFSIQIICNEMSIYWQCMKEMGDQKIVDTGTGSTKINPLYNMATTALNNAQRLSAQYGFTPTSRLRLKIVQDAKPKENKALQLISRKKQLK